MLEENKKISLSHSLANELQISGSMLWESVSKLNMINPDNRITIYLPENTFLFLYYASQGIERLQKIILTLYWANKIENDSNFKLSDDKKLNSLLHGHNHMELNKFILSNLNDKYEIVFDKDTNNFIELLYKFYNKCRYHKFSCWNNLETSNKEFEIFINFTKNKENFKILTGRYLSIIINKYYKIINRYSDLLHLFLTENQNYSFASLVFTSSNIFEEYSKYNLAKKEFIYSLIKSRRKIKLYDNLDIKPIEFDHGFIPQYLKEIINDFGNELYDEVDNFYCDLDDDLSNRLKLISSIDEVF